MAGEDEAEITREREDDSSDHQSGDAPEQETDGSRDQAVEVDSVSDTDDVEDTRVTGDKEDLDSAADSFLDVEQEFDGRVEGMQVRGQAIDVERIPAHEVPADFPYEIDPDDALALTLEIDQTQGKTVTTYFGWPEEGADGRLGRLLALREVPLDRFADLHGEDILLTVENGHFVPVLPKEEPRGDDRAYIGVMAGFATLLFPLIAWLFGASGLIGSSLFFLLFLVIHLVVLPVSIYLDAWDLRSTTNWEGGPLFWAFFAMIPGLNVMTVAAYLVLRQNAEPII